MSLYNTLARIQKEGEEAIVDKLDMIPIDYQEPFCHGEKMGPIFTYRDKRKGLYRQFRCHVCGHVTSLLVARPDEEEEKKV